MKYYISLGMNCDPARHLEDASKRTVSFPFDWAVTPMSAALFHLETKFKFFMMRHHLHANAPAMRKLMVDDDDANFQKFQEGMTTPVFCKLTGSFYPHDFDERPIDDQYDAVMEKYRRRIDRLLQLFEDPKNKFVFIADNVPLHPFQKEQYKKANIGFQNQLTFLDWEQKLKSVMDKTYPNVKWTSYNLTDFKRFYRS